MKRGQGATEFIVILSIILILSGIAMLTTLEFGADAETATTASQALNLASAPIGIISSTLSAKGVQLELVNNLDKVVTVTSLEFDGVIVNSTDLPVTFLPKETRTITSYTYLYIPNNGYNIELTINYASEGFSHESLIRNEKPVIQGTAVRLATLEIDRKEPLNEGLQLYYKFNNRSFLNEEEGVYVDEISSTQMHCQGQANCPVTASISGQTAVNLTDGSDWMNTNFSMANMDDFALSFWFQFRGTQDGYLFDTGGQGVGSYAARVNFPSATQIRLTTINNNSLNIYSESLSAKADNWYHALASRNGTTLSIYINGTVVFNRALSSTLSAGRSLYVGSYGATNTTDGSKYIDEVAVWNRALNEEEIQSIYNRGKVKLQ